MNNLKLSGICLSFILFCFSAAAQDQKTKLPLNEPDYNKPRLFNDLPEKITVDIAELDNVLSGNEVAGRSVDIKFADKKLAAFSGTVVSRSNKEQNKSANNNTVNSIVIRSTNFNGATLTLSSSTQTDGTVKYTGRIISFKHGDLYELEKINGQYTLVKKNFYELVNE